MHTCLSQFNLAYHLAKKADIGEKVANFGLGLLRLGFGKIIKVTKEGVFQELKRSLLERIAAIVFAVLIFPVTILLTGIGFIGLACSKSYPQIRDLLKNREFGKEVQQTLSKTDSLGDFKKITFNTIFTKSPLAQIAREYQGSIVEIISFADAEQDISLILENFLKKAEACKLSRRLYDQLVTEAVINVLEDALKVKYTGYFANDKKLICEFIRRKICRSAHGTRKIAAKEILQNGISFNSKGKKYDYEEFDKIVNDCRLEKTHWPFALNHKRDDKNKFYVSREISQANFYARNNAPEWFLSFRSWGKDENGKLDCDHLRKKIKFHNPEAIDIERVVEFVKKHWDLCGSTKKTASLLIVEQDENDPDLEYRTDYNRIHAKKNLINEYLQFYGELGLERLTHFRMHINQGNINVALSPDNVKKPLKIVGAIKIPL